MRALPVLLLLPALAARGAEAPVVHLSPEVVTAARLPQPGADSPATVRTLDGAGLAAAPAVTLDGALRALPAFSLFRRADSLTANPTAQGVSLRGLGPSGASRSLVLLDGLPLNDPFGGWVAWTKLPREGLEAVEVVPGSGGAAWGNAALGGVVQLLARRPTTEGGTFAALAGDRGVRAAETSFTRAAGGGWLDVAGRWFAADGFPVVAPERRGAVDEAAWSRHRWGQARWRGRGAGGTGLELGVRSFAETRGNGTPYTRNSTREVSGHAALRGGGGPGPAWALCAHVQRQSFASTFSSVNAARSAETPASDQYSVPARAFGVSGTAAWNGPGGARTSAGFDARGVQGETRELFSFTAGRFTRRRIAGGRQDVAGAFAHHDRTLSRGLRFTLGGRVDAWRDSRARREESDRDAGAPLRDERPPDRQSREFSPTAGMVWEPAAGWRLRAAAQGAFRRPTLNELHRPFRQGANITEANPLLRTERSRGGELAAEWRPSQTLRLDLVRFRTDLREAVANVTIARGPGVFPVVGTLAAGGLGRQRLNLDRLRTEGWETSARWAPAPGWAATAALLLNDARVTRAAVAPALAGKEVAQVPRRSLAAGLEGRAPGDWDFGLRVRWLGRQFEDDENLLVLRAATVADLTLRRPLGGGRSVFLTAENLGNARVESGRGADGVVTLASPRLFLAGVRGVW